MDRLPLEVRKRTINSVESKYRVHTNDQYLICIEGINHSRRIFDIAEGLIRRRYDDAEIGLILGGNFERALEETWEA